MDQYIQLLFSFSIEPVIFAGDCSFHFSLSFWKIKNKLLCLPGEVSESPQLGIFSELNDNIINFFHLFIMLIERIVFAPPSPYLDKILVHIKRQGWKKGY